MAWCFPEAVVGANRRKQRERKACLSDSFQWQPAKECQLVCNGRTGLVVVVGTARYIIYEYTKTVYGTEDTECVIRPCDKVKVGR